MEALASAKVQEPCPQWHNFDAVMGMKSKRLAISAILLAASFDASLGAQSSNATAALAGAAGGAALGAGAGQNSTTPSSAGGGGGSSAPIEIQIMAYEGLRTLAVSIAKTTSTELCHADKCSTPILVEDPPAATQIGLYQALEGYRTHLQQLHQILRNSLTPMITPGSATLPSPAGGGPSSATITISNIGTETLTIRRGDINITGTDAARFSVGDVTCGGTVLSSNADLSIPPGQACTVAVKFTPPQQAQTYNASLTIQPQGKAVQTVSLTAIVRSGAISALEFQQRLNTLREQAAELGATVSSGGTGGTGGAGGTGTGAGATTPIELTYLSGIMTALGGLKNGITYSPSSVQPTTQSFEAILQEELRAKSMSPFTATSALNLSAATAELAGEFGDMLRFGSDISSFANQCKPAPGTAQPAGQAPAFNPACNLPDVTVNLAVAQQMITGYTTLLQSSSDGAGNPVIVDIIRGKVLSEAMNDKIPSLQVSVAAAGGNTRTNSFFLLNLFYTPKPSYDAGAVATFELRDKDNVLLVSGARTVLFDYTSTGKLKPKKYAVEKGSVDRVE